MDIIEKLKKDNQIRSLYAASAGAWEGLTIEGHTRMVLRQHTKYFCHRQLPSPLNSDVFRFMLALHDIGKPIAIKKGDKKLQHKYTEAILKRVAPLSEFKDSVDWILAVTAKDPIGEFLKNQIPMERCVILIEDLAKKARMSLKDFFWTLVIYYQVDTLAYTSDAGAIPALDHLYVFDADKHRFCFDHDLGILVFAKDTKVKFYDLVSSLNLLP